MTRRLIDRDSAVQAKCQHVAPCSDCPWARASLPGWLGGASPEDWLFTAHHDHYVECHALTGVQCAGIAIYRRNVVKRVEPPLLQLEKNTELVFSTPMEFKAHHNSGPLGALRK